jgi:outer membrane protein TolC
MVAHARTSARLARLQYIEGEADLTEMLSAQAGLVQAEDARAITLQEQLEAAVDLYAAMGGLPAR